jgi:peptidoglycan-N-acetylglucosamine deacetylase
LGNNLLLNVWDKVAIKTLEFVVDNGGIWHLWGHSWEVEENKDWAKLEGIFHIVGSLSKEIKRIDNSQLLKMYGGKG